MPDTSDLTALADLPLLQSMMDDFYQLTHIPMSLLDAEGTVVVGAGWQDVCMLFHRANPATCENCAESDLLLTSDIPEGEARLYKCRNGMWDAATPLVVNGERLGTVFTGQFFFDDEAIDIDFFARQARRYGFDEEAYLSAIEAVPRLSRADVDVGLRYLTRFATMIAQFTMSAAERERASSRLAEALQAESAVAAENARLYEAQRAVARYSEALNTINRAVNSNQTIHGILREAVSSARDVLGAETAAVFELDGGDIVGIAAAGFGDQPVEGLRMSAQRSPHGIVALESKSLVAIDDALNDPRVERELMIEYGIKSVLAIPLVVRGESVAVLYFNYHSSAVHFSADEIDFAKKLSASLALALENARLLEEERQAREQADADRARAHSLLEASEAVAARESVLKEVALVGSSALRPRELASRVAETTARLFGAKHAQIRLVNEDHTLLLSGGEFDPEGQLQQIGDMPVTAETETAATFREGSPRVGERVTPSVASQSRDNAIRTGVQSYILYPIKAGDETIGIFYMAWSEPREFTEQEQSFFEAVVMQFSSGLQNARLYESQRRRRRRVEALHEVLEVGVATLDVRASAQGILNYLSGHYDFDLASIWLGSGDELELAAHIGFPPSYAESPPALPAYFNRVNEGTRPRGPLVDRQVSDPVLLEFYSRMGLGLSAFVVAPLLSAAGPLGVVSFVWSSPVELNSYDIDFYESVAAEIGVVLENARLYQVEHRIAETLQETLIALPCQLPGVVFSRAYESASSQAGRVGGDFVDLFEVDDRTIGIVVGDVSGKGIDAAVATSLIRNTIRAHATDGLAPAMVVGKTSNVLMRFSDVEAFVTIFFGLLDIQTGLLRYVSAGHPPTLVLSDGRVSSELSSENPIVGAFANLEFRESQAALATGDRLVLYTDGVTEARSLGERQFLEVEGLKQSLEKHSESSTRELADKVMEDVKQFSSGILRDDAAVLVVELTGAHDETMPGSR